MIDNIKFMCYNFSMENKQELIIKEKIDELLQKIEEHLASDDYRNKFSQVYLLNHNGKAKFSPAMTLSDSDLAIHLEGIDYLDFCKIFINTLCEKYIPSETIGLCPQVCTIHVLIGKIHPIKMEGGATKNILSINLLSGNDIETVLDYYNETYKKVEQSLEKPIEQ